MSADDTYPDVDWSESVWTVLERDRRIRELEKLNAELYARAGSAMRVLGTEIVRSGNAEAKLGIAIMERIVMEREMNERYKDYQRNVPL